MHDRSKRTEEQFANNIIHLMSRPEKRESQHTPSISQPRQPCPFRYVFPPPTSSTEGKDESKAKTPQALAVAHRIDITNPVSAPGTVPPTSRVLVRKQTCRRCKARCRTLYLVYWPDLKTLQPRKQGTPCKEKHYRNSQCDVKTKSSRMCRERRRFAKRDPSETGVKTAVTRVRQSSFARRCHRRRRYRMQSNSSTPCAGL